MHEYSIVQALLAKVGAEAEAHGASAVRRIRVQIGELSGVEGDLLRSAYDLFRGRSPWAGGELELVPVEARWTCPRCDRALARGQILRCPTCGCPAQLAEGGDIVLERLELEVA